MLFICCLFLVFSGVVLNILSSSAIILLKQNTCNKLSLFLNSILAVM